MLPATTWLNGAGAIAVLAAGWFICASFAVKHRTTGKKLLPWVSFLGFCLGGFYIEATTSFFLMVFSGNILSLEQAGMLGYFLVPPGICTAMYLGFSIFKPSKIKAVVIAYSLAGVVFYIGLLGFPSMNIGGMPGIEGEMLPDTTLAGMLFILGVFYNASALIILGFNFFALSRKIKGPEKTRARFLFWGFVLFAVGAMLETGIPGDFQIIARAVLVASYACMHKGFSS